MTQPTLSICIPTYKRPKLLHYLLSSLHRQKDNLAHSYEVVIADNGSADETESVVAEFKDKLPIRYFRRDRNYGPDDNRVLLHRESKGLIQAFVADDDDLILAEVSTITDRMMADPEIGVIFAPWMLYDRVAQRPQGTFFSLDQDIIIERGDYEALLSLILKHHIFPESLFVRSEVIHRSSGFIHLLAYWAFVQATEYLDLGKVAFFKEPYYVSITRHSLDDNRQQMGHIEAQDGWDRYRGGLEYILSRIPHAALTPEKRLSFLQEIQKFTAMRMNVALQLRIRAGRDPIDSYYIASRISGMGFPEMLPQPFDILRYHAVAQHVLVGPAGSKPIDKIVCVGNIPPGLYQAIKTCAGQLPVIVAQQFDMQKHSQAAVVAAGTLSRPDPALLAASNIRLFDAADLMRKFS